MDTERIVKFGLKIQRLIDHKDLSYDESYAMFKEILLNQQPDLQQGAFLAALVEKGETPEEIAGAWKVIYEIDTVKIKPDIKEPVVENCGTGMDQMQTFNISTAAAIVAAANGIYMAKHGARAITSRCGAVDILEALGVDVDGEVELVKKSIENAGIGIFNGMSSKVHPQALGRILSQIRFGTTLNIAGSLANPCLPKYAVRGVYKKDMVSIVAGVMKEIGYKKAIVVHGLNEDKTRGIDEVSSFGETIIAELKEDGEISNYTIMPEDMGIKRARYKDILEVGAQRAVPLRSFLKILTGKDRGPKHDIVCLNTAPILYMMNKVADFEEGVKKAGEIIKSGQAIEKLRQWVREQNRNPERGLSKLDNLLAQIHR
ncbi:anthranilate phosphoribosyltransferase [bacterium]|nr:anthranilate phosphoribosyltransferase [bacterium]